MIKIELNASSIEKRVKQIQHVIGGKIHERWGEYTLDVYGPLANGSIRFITFEWGVGLLEFDITFHEDIHFELDASTYNPIHFIYCLEGKYGHRYSSQEKNDIQWIEQYQSVILTGRDGGFNNFYFRKSEKLALNFIQIKRKQFLKKRLNNVDQLNKKLYDVFLDSDHEKTFVHYGAYNLKLADKISALRKVKTEGMIRIMQIEGLVYEVLSMHLSQHDKALRSPVRKSKLLHRELKKIRSIAKSVVANPSKEFTLTGLSKKSGLSQAKLQSGFQFLYARTVTEYIRHCRLEAARDYMRNSDMNVSEIVYTVGFSSRSYFSKIFKKKYGMSPSEFLNSMEQRGEDPK
jgi:AraC-like DNA-binding protein